MNQNTHNQSLTQEEYELHISKYVYKGWDTMLNSTVYFMGMGFLFIIFLFLTVQFCCRPIFEFIVDTIDYPRKIFLFAIVVSGSILFLTFFLLSRYYFYLAKSITGENTVPFSFRLMLADLSQLYMSGIAFLILFGFASAPFFFSVYQKLQDRKMKPDLHSPPTYWEYQLLSLFLIIYVFTCLLFVSQLIMFGKLKFVEAIKTSFKIVHKNILKSLLFSVVVLLIAFSGFLFIYIGTTFTIPLAACILSAAYDDLEDPHIEELDKKIEQIGIF